MMIEEVAVDCLSLCLSAWDLHGERQQRLVSCLGIICADFCRTRKDMIMKMAEAMPVVMRAGAIACMMSNIVGLLG
jgi:hypothetical protein